jgi:tetratricopeptide (TPR) repeat protein
MRCAAAIPAAISAASPGALLRRAVGAVVAAALAAALAGAGPAHGAAADDAAASAPLKALFGPLNDGRLQRAPHPLAGTLAAVLDLLAQARLPEASAALNAALKRDPANASLHLLNGLVYHLMARQGDSAKRDTAIEGYRAAIHFDASNWVAHEFLGLAYFEQRNYRQALASFAEVLLQRPDDPDTLLRGMAAAYLGGDSAMACVLAERAGQQSAVAQDRSFLRASVLVYAACGNSTAAQAQRSRYFELPLSGDERQRIDRRLDDWAHAQRQLAVRTQYETPAPGAMPG